MSHEDEVRNEIKGDAKPVISTDNAPTRSELSEKIKKLEYKDKLAIIISTLALIVSGSTFVVNIFTSYRDKVYKELAIQPEMLIFANTKEKSWGVVSRGAGAAKIKRVAFRDNIGCIDSKFVPDILDKQGRFFQKISSDIETEAKFSVNSKLQDHFNLEKNYFSTRVTPENIFVSGSSTDIFRFEGAISFEDVEDLSADKEETDKQNRTAKLLAESVDKEQTLRNSFEKVIRRKSMKIEYCSLSGELCKFAGAGDNVHFCDE